MLIDSISVIAGNFQKYFRTTKTICTLLTVTLKYYNVADNYRQVDSS